MSELTDRIAALPEAKRRLLEKLLEQESAPRQQPEVVPFSLLSDADRDALPAGLEDAYPLSRLQAGMVYHAELTPEYPLYHNVNSSPVRVDMDLQAFQAATDEVVARHPALRTAIAMSGYREPLQLVHRSARLEVGVDDLRGRPADEVAQHVRAFVEAEKRRRFDLERPPLLRLHVHRLGDDEFQLTVTDFHPVLDGWSLSLVLAEILEIYRALCRGEEPPPSQAAAGAMHRYVGMERQALEREETRRYWERHLAGAEALELPRRSTPAASEGSPVRLVRVDVPGEQVRGLRTLAREAGVPLKSVLLAAHVKAMSLCAGTADVLTGLTVHGRPEVPGGDRAVGLFLNTVPFRFALSRGSWYELASSIFGAEKDLLPHQRYPLAELQRGRDRPLFDSAFNIAHFHAFKGLEEAGVRGSSGVVEEREENHFPLYVTFTLDPSAATLRINLECQRERFDAEQAGLLGEVYRAVLAAMAADPAAVHHTADLLPAAERRRQMEIWNRTGTTYPDARGLDEILVERLTRRGGGVVVSCGTDRRSADDVLRTSAALARALRRRGAGPEERVGLLLDRSADLPAVLLGVLRSGACYVPLDPTHPPRRNGLILEDAAPRWIITLPSLADGLPEGTASEVLFLEDLLAEEPEPEPPVPTAGVERLAYVLYTSGTTGRPKGVAVAHRPLVNFLLSMVREPDFRVGDVLLALTTLAFDISALELYLPLLGGGRVEVLPAGEAADPESLMAALERVEPTVVQGTPATWRMLLDAGWEGRPGLKVLCGGEALPRDLADRLLATGAELWNMYGPTETTVWSGTCRVERADGPVPVGSPIANTQLRVVGPFGELLPTGATGRLLIGGDGLARGYLGQPGRTAERFRPDPRAGRRGARLYDTGDLARHRSDGLLEFLGRVDRQVKLRGFRIELGEIEGALRGDPAVREAVVTLVERGAAGSVLAAYVLPEEDADPPTAAELRNRVGERLPAYMVPSSFTLLKEIPLTPSGKVDRKALPAPELAVAVDGERASWVAPETPTQQLVAAVWEEILSLDQVGLDDDFFALGGHSLLATQMIARLRQALGVELPLRRLFQRPTVAGLAAMVEEELHVSGGQAVPPVEPAPRDGAVPLSFAQQRLWFLDRFEPESWAYNVPAAVWLRGSLNGAALAASLDAVVARHEILRTTYQDSPDRGEPVQTVHPPRPRPLPRIDLSALPADRRRREVRRRMDRLARIPFDLAAGPVLRSALFRLDPAEHVLTVTVHHIASDGWSMGLLFRELLVLYEARVADQAPSVPELPVQYADFAIWQRAWMSGERLNDQLEFWKRRLADLPPSIDLPIDRPRPRSQTFAGDIRSLRLAEAVVEPLETLSRRHTATPFMIFLAAFTALLARYSGQRDLVVGTPVTGRNRVEIEHLIGFFVNTLVLRADLSGRTTFEELVERVREVVLEAHANQDLPFEKLVEELQPERSLSHSPLFQVMFSMYTAARGGNLEMRGLEVAREEPPTGTSKFDLTFILAREADHLLVSAEYNTDLFDATTVERMLRQYGALLVDAGAHPGRDVAALQLLAPVERHQLLREWNDRTVALPETTLPAVLAARAKRHPERPAVGCGEEQLSYGELVRRVDAVAAALLQRGVGAGDLVGIYMERGVDLPVATLGVLRSGAAYLPLDPEYPVERIRYVLDDAGAALLLVDGDGDGDGESPDVSALPCPRLPVRQAREAGAAPPAVLPNPDDLAYAIYTSGSTGRPKGVEVTHRSLLNFLRAMEQRPGFGADDVLLAVTSLSFDISALELYLPLLAGGRVEVANRSEVSDGLALGARLAACGATVMQATPAGWRLLLDSGWSGGSLRALCGGEALPPELASELAGRTEELWNMYGPTETTVWSAVEPVEADTLPILVGRPIDNTSIHVVDPTLDGLPPGAVGELCIGGSGLARGYRGRPALTADAFRPDPFAALPGARLYRTGDLARHRRDGRLQVLGRVDHQVKIRGYRIELGEVEAVLEEHPAVQQAVVHPVGEGGAADRLAAFVTPDREWLTEADQRERRLEEWRDVWDDTYRTGEGRTVREDLDLSGWKSSYTGLPVPEDEMREWVDHGVECIRALEPEQILEIGCGTGLLLQRLAPSCRRYLGTDFSPSVIRDLEERVVRNRLTGVELQRRLADDFEGIPEATFDTVVLNSVVQYFPSLDYLEKVLEGAVRSTAAGGAVFVGDVRSLPLLHAFHVSVELHRTAGSTPVDVWRRRVRQRVREEEELILDPRFFVALARRWPRVIGVRVMPKRGRSDNEMVRFRYDVVLEVESSGEPGEPVEWRPWRSDRHGLADLRRHLAEERPQRLALFAVPNRRLEVVASLEAQAEEAATVEALRRAVVVGEGLDPEEIHRLAAEAGYVAELSWRRADPQGRFDLLLRLPEARAAAFPDPEEDPPAAANEPLVARLAQRLPAELRDRLRDRLPPYMVPASLSVLPDFPLTPNGKVDRRALVEMEGAGAVRGEYLPPRGRTEVVLAELFADVLGLERVGAGDDFFSLGGHSLLATRAVSRIREELGVEIPLRSLFQAPTVRALGRLVDQRRRQAGDVGLPPVLPVGRDRPLPLSFAQQRLWFLDRLHPDRAATWNMAVALRWRGEMAPAALGEALTAVVARHEVLRTRLLVPPGEDLPVQVVDPAPTSMTLPRVDLSALPERRREAEARRCAAREAAIAFVLDRDLMVRARLLRFGGNDHALLLTLHHVAADGWSLDLLVRELAALYQARLGGGSAALPDLPVQYGDYAVWQRRHLEGEVLDEQLLYWRRRLGGDLPRVDPAALGAIAGGDDPGDMTSASVPFRLPPDLAAAVDGLARREGATLFMVLLAGLVSLLAGRTGGDEVLVGTDVANRTRGETEDLIGFFVNQLVLRVETGCDPSFQELLAQVRRITLEAYSHQEAPFDRLVEMLAPERRRERNPLFQVKLVHQDRVPGGVPAPPGVELASLDTTPPPARFDLALFTEGRRGGVQGQWVFPRALFAAEAVEALSRDLVAVLRAAVAKPETRLRRLAVLRPGDRERDQEGTPRRRSRARKKFFETRPKQVDVPEEDSNQGDEVPEREEVC